MHTSNPKWMMAAAVLTGAADASSAQTLRAEIPFTFRAGRAVLPAGSYEVVFKDIGSRPIPVLRSRDESRGVVLAQYAIVTPRAGRNAKLVFACGSDAVAPDMRPAHDERARIAEIALESARAN